MIEIKHNEFTRTFYQDGKGLPLYFISKSMIMQSSCIMETIEHDDLRCIRGMWSRSGIVVVMRQDVDANSGMRSYLCDL